MHDYLLDTNILGHLAEFRAGISNSITDRLKKHLKDRPHPLRIHLCPISIGEVEYGIRVGPYDKDYESIKKILLTFDCFDINRTVAYENYSKLRSKLYDKYALKEKKEKKAERKRVSEWFDPTIDKDLQVNENDVWIAAVAMTYNFILVTNDKMTAIRSVAGSELQFEDWLS